MPKKSFGRVNAFAEQVASPKVAVLPKPHSAEVINLDSINLEDRGNWLRAIEAARPNDLTSLPELLKQIESYQGQIDRAVQIAQAQSTIYAYAIGTRLESIEKEELFRELGYNNLTEFVKAGEIRRPRGESITARQVWTYRRVTRGLNEFLSLVESLRTGESLPEDVQEQVTLLGQQIHTDVVEVFLESYVDSIAGILELGVSKLEQVYRLPKAVALSGLLAGQLSLEKSLIPVHDISFSKLRKAISQHGRERNHKPKLGNLDKTLTQIEQLIENLVGSQAKLSKQQQERLKVIYKKLGLFQDAPKP